MIALLTLLVLAAPPQKAPIAVLRPDCVGVDADGCTAVGRLLQSELRRLGWQVRASETACGDPLCAADAARSTQTSEAISMSISRLETRLVLEATRVSDSGVVLFADRVIAATLDDLDTLALRIARALTDRVPIAETVQPGTVSLYEARFMPKKRSTYLLGAQLSTRAPVGSAYAGASPMSGAAAVMYLELDRWLTMASAGADGGKAGKVRASTSWLEGGVYRILSDQDMSPYAGIGANLKHVSLSGGEDKYGEPFKASGSGNAISAGAGLLLFRTADIRVVAQASYSVDLFKTNGGYGHGVLFSVGAMIH